MYMLDAAYETARATAAVAAGPLPWHLAEIRAVIGAWRERYRYRLIDVVHLGAGEAAFGARHGIALGVLAGRCLGLGEAGAAAGGARRPRRASPLPRPGAQLPRSTGAPTRLPHSVQDPS